MKSPKFVKFWCDNGKKWLESHPNINTKGMDIYEKFVMLTFYDTLADFELAMSGMFGKVDCKAFLERYFNITL